MSKPVASLFDRSYGIALAPSTGAQAAQYSNVGKDASALRIGFDIQKNVKSSPNKAVFSLYNMSPATRGNIAKGTLVTFSAGYGEMAGNLFLGVVQRASTEKSGSDVVTKIECGDGEPSLAKVCINQNFPPGPQTTLAQIMQVLAQTMSVTTPANPQGINAGVAMGIPVVTFPRGFVAKGRVRDVMDALCKSHGLEWSIQNGALDIIPRGAHAGNQAIVLSAATGLIGIPSLNEGTLTFSALLNPMIAPNRLVVVQLRGDTRLNGFYKVTSAKYEGDTHDAKWQADCEAVALPNAQQQRLAAATGFNYATATV